MFGSIKNLRENVKENKDEKRRKIKKKKFKLNKLILYTYLNSFDLFFFIL